MKAPWRNRRDGDVGIDLVPVDLLAVDQRGEAERFREEVEALLHAELLRGGGGDGIERLLDGERDRDDAVPIVRRVVRPEIAPVLVVHNRHVVHGGAVGQQPALDGERIDGQRLNRRAALPLALHGAVEAARYGFLAAAADHAEHIAGVGVHHDHRRLRRDAVGLREAILVGKDLLHRALDDRVFGGNDLQAAGIEHPRGDGAVDGVLLHQRVGDVVDERVDEIGVDRLARVFLLAFGVEVKRLVVGVVEFLLRDLPLIEHLLEHHVAALEIVLGVTDGVVLRRGFRDCRQRGAFDERQLVERLAEVGLRGRLDAVAVLRQIDDVEVHLQDFFLRELGLDVDGAENLLHLALDGGVVVL